MIRTIVHVLSEACTGTTFAWASSGPWGSAVLLFLVLNPIYDVRVVLLITLIGITLSPWLKNWNQFTFADSNLE